MDDDYYDVTAQLDAREILRYLNNLGIHNISGEVLKYFITDLKKFIKHDLQQRNNSRRSYTEEQWPDRLHSASTFSSRVRSKAMEGEVFTCYRGCHTAKHRNFCNTHSAPVLRQKTEEKPLRRACSCVREKKSDTVFSQTKVAASSNNIIKIPKQPQRKKCDPVSLYHYYTSLWAKYKPNVPGENDWSDLRWRVRQKMATAGFIKEPVSKVPESQVRVKSHEK